MPAGTDQQYSFRMPPETTETPPETLTDRELLEQVSHQLDHLDVTLHGLIGYCQSLAELVTDINVQVQKAAPLLDRFVGNPVADYLAHRRENSRGRRARTAD
jgi:hypothetical protein